MDVSRRDFMKLAGVAALTTAVGNFGSTKTAEAATLIKTQAPVIGSKNVIGEKISSASAKLKHCRD